MVADEREKRKRKSMSESDKQTNKPDSPVYESREEHDAVKATCTWGGYTYVKGDTRCSNGVEYECGESGWFKNGNSC